MFREGVEAALIVATLLAYLRRLDEWTQARWVAAGTIAALLVSVLAGVILFYTVGELEGTAEQITEGIIAVVAAGLLTWMIFWMGRRARALRGELQAQVDSALSSGGALALAAVAFVAVAREGLESALFLISTTVGESAATTQLLGGLGGVIVATAVGFLVYKGGTRINLRLLFRITGVVIILFAAGLVATAIHEFQEFGGLPIIVEHVWQLDWADPDGHFFWALLKSLLGWRHAPSLLMVIGYVGYLVPIMYSFLRVSGVPRRVPPVVKRVA